MKKKLSILNVECHASSIKSTNTPVLCWHWVILLISLERLPTFSSLLDQRPVFVPDFVLFVELNVEQKTGNEEHEYLTNEENKVTNEFTSAT